jgi:hypothetical protein
LSTLPPDDDEPRAEPVPTLSTAPERVEPKRPSGPTPTRSVIGAVVAVACAYELFADGINIALQEPVLPSAATLVARFRGRAVAARLAPRPARVGAMLGTGYLIGVITAGKASKKTTS